MREKVSRITTRTGVLGSVSLMSALQRPRRGKVIAGVCAGLAQRYGWPPNTVRAVFVVSWLLLPESG